MATDFHFLTEIEDVEREAWWLISKNRLKSTTTPWRALEKALNDHKQIKKKLPASSLCQKMQVLEKSGEWIITSHCLATPVQLAKLLKKSDTLWSIEIPTASFKEHFGLQTSIYSNSLKCDFETNKSGVLQKLQCPVYARDLNSEEWVELKDFNYAKKEKELMNIQGSIKSQFEIVATLSTVIPQFGDITVKEVRIPQKPAEGSLNAPPSR